MGEQGQANPERIIIYAESGLLAGDLAALLSARFAVQRVTSAGGARRALREKALAFMVVETGSEAMESRELVQAAADQGVRVFLLGEKPPRFSFPPGPGVVVFPSLPDPLAILAALQEPPKAKAAEA